MDDAVCAISGECTQRPIVDGLDTLNNARPTHNDLVGTFDNFGHVRLGDPKPF
jgi:hypothetical protein